VDFSPTSANKRRLLILSEIISPYRIPVFNALARHRALDLHVVFLAETDPQLRQWRIYRQEIQFSHEVLPSWRLRVASQNILLNWGVAASLSKFAPDSIICGGYNYYASWEALSWARRRHATFVLWSESNIQDARRGRTWTKKLKSNFLARCDGFVVPGKSARDYLLAQGMNADRIATAPNAVDNAWFAAQAETIRARASEFRRNLGLPERYILFVGRLVEAKGVFDLLDAYGRLEDSIRSEVGLVFAGDGDCRAALEYTAAALRPGKIIFMGFTHREDLAGFYALAEALFLPTHSDPWGLVVNEAMACGLPVVVTSVAGCAADLVEDGWNGYVVPPANPEALTIAMERLVRRNDAKPSELEARELEANQVQGNEARQRMGTRSYERIQAYSPEACAAGLAAAALAQFQALNQYRSSSAERRRQ
jgi:glycosyltransferase involved in cell wall biosynthesis